MKRFRIRNIIVLHLLSVALWAQGTYYTGIDTGSATFVTDLHDLIYPHTQISYDNYKTTIIPNYESRDTTGGQKVVTCVYSGENYVYTAPFAWTTFSREHTFCHSWMPTHPSESGPEYSDQHHLFPTNQNNANGRRSNHPLGEVTSISYQYLEGKLGTNSLGQTVYEPRESHKGDAARALLYMAVCYNGVGGNDWTFNYLNTVRLPALSEAAQDVDLLIEWHNQDPPDDWEEARNEYIYSIQGNRNPFVDHPEYVNVIDFNTLTKKTTVSLAAEPTNYASSFTFDSTSASAVFLSWNDAAAGTQVPSGYLLIGSTGSSITGPSDGVVYSDDTNLADGYAVVNIPYADADTYTFSGLNQATTYYFKLYSYNGTGSARNYKTAATIPGIQATTGGTGTSLPVVVNEYKNGSSQAEEWVELAVLGNNVNMQGMLLRDYSTNGSIMTGLTFSNSSVWASLQRGTIIVVLANGSTLTEDFDPADNLIVVKASNTVYFSGSSFNISGTADAIELLSSGSVHIHSLSHGSYPGSIATIPQPRANAIGPSTSGNVVRFINVSSENDFSDTTNVGHSTSATYGSANDAAEQNFFDTPNPVELSRFAATVKNNNVELLWETATELNNHGFEIERKSADRWVSISFIAGNGTSNIVHRYSFIDRNLKNGRHAYRLKQIDNDGSFEYLPEINVVVHGAPSQFGLLQNYPNPFNPSTMIGFTLHASGLTTLKVYDAVGREIATLADEYLEAGVHHQRQFNGSELSNGIYFYTLRSGNFSATKTLLLMK